MMEYEPSQAWHEVIRGEKIEDGQNILAWEVVEEGAIVSVSQTETCTGVTVYLFGGPDDPTMVDEVPYMWLRENQSKTFPNLRGYHSCSHLVEIRKAAEKNPQPWINTGRSFLDALRNQPKVG